MSSSYSANQYESAFKAHKLLNWTVPKHFKERPSAAEGRTTFIASDRGHLLPGVKAKHGSSWPSFQGTWDLPRRIPPIHINPTARSQEGQERLRVWGQAQQHQLQSGTGKPYKVQGDSRATSRTQHAEDTNMDQQSEELLIPVSTPGLHGSEAEPGRPLSQLSEAQPQSASQQSQVQSRPVSQQKQAESRPASQQKQSQSRPASQQKQAESRPLSQQKQAQFRPASQHMQDGPSSASQQKHTESRPATQQRQDRKPASQQNEAESRPLIQDQLSSGTDLQPRLTDLPISKEISKNLE